MYCSLVFGLFITITGGVFYDEDHRIETCTAVYQEAVRQGVDPDLAISVAWLESRWYASAKNKKSGALGPMQVLPKYWCPNKEGIWRIHEYGVRKGCNLTKAGVRALKYYTTTRKSIESALADYGNTSKKSAYVRQVKRLVRGAKNKRTP